MRIGQEGNEMAGSPVIEPLDEAECLKLLEVGEVGRLASPSRYGPAVLPVNYRLHEGKIVFRTGVDSPLDEDLRTGIAGAGYKVAFEIDSIDPAAREGWSVLVQGTACHVETDAARAELASSGVEPWPGGDRELFIQITPTRITGRRIRHQ
jgi:nitroimidazol reductase NimA-like FMN-containing flavoprotein (pyridoxamine 5'-phosphate oxidase superfamily)